MCKVSLSKMELVSAAIVGIMRHIESILGGHKDGAIRADNGWTLHVEGAAAEMALAKWADRYWSHSVNTFKDGDVGKLQVRVRYKHSYDLVVRDKDSPGDHYVHMTGLAPNFKIRGWMVGKDAMLDRYRKDPGDKGKPAWFVPSDDLDDDWDKLFYAISE